MRSSAILSAALLFAAGLPALKAADPAPASPPAIPAHTIASGKFQPTWESLQTYECPEWFRDAKFGIWAHWSAQCQPEQGDWYGRNMYLQGTPQYEYHVKTYGHPSKFGFMEIDNLWKAENWDPEKLMALYKAAGAKYFMALANHHDNFDNWDSKYHAWNSVNVGPKKDIIGTWAKVARANGLRFGVSNHSAHAWHWFGPAYGYDGDGPQTGVRYDAATLTKADGKDKWWEGLDPQELYTGNNIPMPDGIKGVKEVNDWHLKNDRPWNENPPPMNPAFTENWYLRCQDLLDKYHPDLLYYDNSGLPLGQTGLDITAHYYNANTAYHRGKLEAVAFSKKMKGDHALAIVDDFERGFTDNIQARPWQTDTCLGDWHYNRALFEKHGYKTAETVIQRLCDIVSKNGNLCLSVPLRGDGTIDADELQVLEDMAAWMKVNGEAIFATRPWKVFGEGPTIVKAGMFGERNAKPFTPEDIRFTKKSGTLYAIVMGWPGDGKDMLIKTLAANSPQMAGQKISDVSLLGYEGKLEWSQDDRGLTVKMPEKAPSAHAVALQIKGAPTE